MNNNRCEYGELLETGSLTTDRGLGADDPRCSARPRHNSETTTSCHHSRLALVETAK